MSEWKLGNVTPLFKKGDKSNPGNYRPISLTSVVCKLMESILRDKIVEFLEKCYFHLKINIIILTLTHI